MVLLWTFPSRWMLSPPPPQQLNCIHRHSAHSKTRREGLRGKTATKQAKIQMSGDDSIKLNSAIGIQLRGVLARRQSFSILIRYYFFMWCDLSFFLNQEPMEQCPYDPGHRVPVRSMERHKASCYLTKMGYSSEEQVTPFYSFDFHLCLHAGK